jgi:signal peptidase I
MQPTLYTDERMAVTIFSYYFNTPQRGDVVVTKYPDDSRNFVKRVIGLPGETLEIKDGKVYIDGVELDEPYISEEINFDYGEITIGEGKYFVMGDNRNNSRDSRYINVGPLDEELIVGKAQYVVWPFGELRRLNHYEGHIIEN